MRICLYGGPGSSKSTTAAWLFSELKTRRFSIELVSEYVKTWAYDKRRINEFSQIYIFGKQLHYEYRYLESGVRNIITDSPVFLASIYSDYYHDKIDLSQQIEKIADKYEERFPSLNIFLNRKDKPYIQEGRYQDYESAIKLDEIIKEKIMNKFIIGKNLFFIDYNDRNIILDKVLRFAD